ncbi:MAG: hypothetical protein KDE33_25310 [Bacteroidetes bacterium]|nr:hypothetical protein [Bacteroidota bacterium]
MNKSKNMKKLILTTILFLTLNFALILNIESDFYISVENYIQINMLIPTGGEGW